MGSLTIHELPESERPREKLAQLGAGALSDAELIAILLRVGVKGTNAIELARQLLRDHGSLAGLARCSVRLPVQRPNRERATESRCLSQLQLIGTSSDSPGPVILNGLSSVNVFP